MYQKNPSISDLTFPIYVLPKLDGIRCLIHDGRVLSRSLKPIPNRQIRECLRDLPTGLDGELIVGNPTDEDVYRRTNSFVMAEKKEGPFNYYIFDYWNVEAPYKERLKLLQSERQSDFDTIVKVVPAYLAATEMDLLEMENRLVGEGYEGVILRNPHGIYKYGRTTLKENNGFKLKRFEDSEAIVLRVLPEMHNANEAKRGATGKIERSTAASGLIAKERMGAIVVYDPTLKVEFNIGTGFSADERDWWWEHGQEVIDQKRLIKYKFFPVGVKEKPRHPVYKGFRDKIDL
jgi:DNA ligase-1